MNTITFTEHETALLWGWDKRLWHWMRRRDMPALAEAIRKRLLSRATTCLVRTDPRQAELHESAERGWKLIADRLAAKQAEAA